MPLNRRCIDWLEELWSVSDASTHWPTESFIPSMIHPLRRWFIHLLTHPGFRATFFLSYHYLARLPMIDRTRATTNTVNDLNISHPDWPRGGHRQRLPGGNGAYVAVDTTLRSPRSRENQSRSWGAALRMHARGKNTTLTLWKIKTAIS